MWPTEREALAVWADELQAKGERLGELIAIHLRAEEVRAPGGRAEHAAVLEREAEALRLELAEQLLGPAVGELSRLRLRWQHGLVRSMHLDRSAIGDEPPPKVVLEVVTKLLQRPVLRYLDTLHLEGLAIDAGIERALLSELARSECVARPRRVILGRMPQRILLRPVALSTARRHVIERSQHGRPPPRELLESVSARGLTWLGSWGVVQSLPWAAGDHGSRLQQLERMLAMSWTQDHGEALVRALWDTSMRVRRRVLTILPQLPDEAAPALLAALAIDRGSRRSFGDVVERCLTRIASERPSWIAAAAEEFSLAEPWVARWLAGVGHRAKPAARRAIPRVQAMLRRLRRRSRLPDHRVRQLREALTAFGEREADEPGGWPFDDETIAELVTKIGEHR